jgi:hypothetical protein
MGTSECPVGIALLLIVGWEFSLGVYLVVKGFKSSPITAASQLPTTANSIFVIVPSTT